jgi:hypothetical protein
MADAKPRQQLFQYAVLFHPKPTKDQIETGERPKSVVVTDITTILAGSEQEVGMLAARSVGTAYEDKLEDVEILIRPF